MEDLLAVFANSEAAFPVSLMPMVTEIISRDLSVLCLEIVSLSSSWCEMSLFREAVSCTSTRLAPNPDF